MKKAGLFLLALIAFATPAAAVTVTTKYSLTNTAWTDLGAGPILLGFTGTGAVYAVGDATPSITGEGFVLPAGSSVSIPTTSHVWAMTRDAPGAIAYVTPATSSGGGGGGAVTIVDGGSVTLGAKADAAAIGPSSTLMSVMRAVDADIKGTDPCTSSAAKTNFTFSASTARIGMVAPNSTLQTYICSLTFFVDTPAVKVSVIGGTAADCSTGVPVAMAGSTSAASGMSIPLAGGMTFGSGVGTVLRTTTAGHGACILQSGTTLIAGGGTYVQQ